MAYAQQARQNSNYEQSALNERMQEYMRQVVRENQRSSFVPNETPNEDAIQPVSRKSHKLIEAVMHSTVEGKVHLMAIH